MNLRNLKWMKLCQLFYIIRIKRSSYYTVLLNFFLNTWVWFRLGTLEGDMMRGREKVFTYAAFFCVCVI